MFGAIKIAFVAIIALIVVGGLYHISNLKANLAIAEANTAKLEEGIQAQNNLINQMKADIENIQKMNKQLAEENEKQKKDTDALAKKFDQRDFGAFVAAQPVKALAIINRGTANALRCIELASGAPLNEKEKTAKTPTEANRECPSLINPSSNPLN